ncbi:hypothetical protein EVAR_96931_1 [Eumeta japonica]|uniref:Uncharacterized protein n=1 Tax=Eumeta variegata TaxID=151549 RepID=A0A4C1ZVP9_EUMVA|nr:hypothetical protein EVAR_96931_1 [Eumeta japonica]
MWDLPTRRLDLPLDVIITIIIKLTVERVEGCAHARGPRGGRGDTRYCEFTSNTLSYLKRARAHGARRVGAAPRAGGRGPGARRRSSGRDDTEGRDDNKRANVTLPIPATRGVGGAAPGSVLGDRLSRRALAMA